MPDLNKFDDFYRSAEGEKMAREELLPVIERYCGSGGLKILEVGCGYGRNLEALSGIAGSNLSGCDISAEDLSAADKRAKEFGRPNIKLSLQADKNKLPYGDNQFDLVVLWQVLEHVPSKAEKKSLLSEVSRVTKNNGSVLIETPNFFFPIDYHDTSLPFVHYLPAALRQALIKRLRKRDFPPSFYTSVYQIKKFLSSFPGAAAKKESLVFFEKKYFDIFRHLGGTRQGSKKIFFILYFPIYVLLRLLKIDGDLFAPSVRAVFRIEKK